MDNSLDKEIHFDSNGICNYCHEYEARAKTDLFPGEVGEKLLSKICLKVKKDGKGRKYDCIIGLSGGIDSAMVAYVVKKKLGLRPLAVHLDNGWNLELSVSNIENIVNKLDIDLVTVILDWNMFKDLHLSFLKASVMNSEIPTDHAINAVLFSHASKHGIKYIFSGSNIATEGLLPESWCGYDNKDWKFIKGIHKKFGVENLTTYPRITIFDWIYYVFIKKIKFFPVLNYIDYDKKKSLDFLNKEIGFRPYGPKHGESIYTRFFQSYILPKKFGIDKRKPHLSSMINSKIINRDEALDELAKSPLASELIEQDKEFVMKKFNLTPKEFESIMQLPIKTFKDYPNSNYLFKGLSPIVAFAKKLTTLR